MTCSTSRISDSLRSSWKNVSLQAREPDGGRRIFQLFGRESLTEQRTSTGHKRMHSEVSSRPTVEMEMAVREDYWPHDSQERLDEAIADAKSY